MPEPFDPFGGFAWERRLKPITTVGRKQGTVAGKLFNTIHACTMECGSKHLRKARDAVKGYVRDQGAGERGTAKAPVGNLAEIRDKLSQVSHGDLTYADVTKLVSFWPNSFEHSDMCHIIQNAIEDACTAEPEWKSYETLLKASCKLLGDSSSKDIILHEVFDGAPAAERMHVHRFSAELVDWRWEFLEHASEQITDLWCAFACRFDPKVFKDAVSSAAKVKEAIDCPWLGNLGFSPGQDQTKCQMQVVANRFDLRSWVISCMLHLDVICLRDQLFAYHFVFSNVCLQYIYEWCNLR